MLGGEPWNIAKAEIFADQQLVGNLAEMRAGGAASRTGLAIVTLSKPIHN